MYIATSRWRTLRQRLVALSPAAPPAGADMKRSLAGDASSSLRPVSYQIPEPTHGCLMICCPIVFPLLFLHTQYEYLHSILGQR